ncbi:MAG: hypothetical protein KJ592_04625 [Nanoarchaeota archaeon]|nr:hypothetical protein [Nanoarchaeota archaeon]
MAHGFSQILIWGNILIVCVFYFWMSRDATLIITEKPAAAEKIAAALSGAF